jgi:hypothetical protein
LFVYVLFARRANVVRSLLAGWGVFLGLEPWPLRVARKCSHSVLPSRLSRPSRFLPLPIPTSQSPRPILPASARPQLPLPTSPACSLGLPPLPNNLNPQLPTALSPCLAFCSSHPFPRGSSVKKRNDAGRLARPVPCPVHPIPCIAIAAPPKPLASRALHDTLNRAPTGPHMGGRGGVQNPNFRVRVRAPKPLQLCRDRCAVRFRLRSSILDPFMTPLQNDTILR